MTKIRALVVGAALAALGLTACSGDDACSPGCANGQQCVAGPDGKKGCYCTVTGDTGCPTGQTCQNTPQGFPSCFCSPVNNTGCDPGKVCENIVSANPGCFPPVTLGGKVFDLATSAAIGGARVVARDANNAAASDVTTTDPTGNYNLVVPTPRKADGTPTTHEVFLRVDATSYVSFPTAPRVALPIDMAKATGTPLRLESSATSVGLLKLAATTGLGTISGKVIADHPGGTLVVAGGATGTGGGATGIAGSDGTYAVFNVPQGSVTVRGYKASLQLAPATAQVTPGAETRDVNLTSTGQATAVVSGKVEIVNPGSGTNTSVILAVDETFVESAAHGDAPPGMRAYPVSGTFSISGVPDGNYVVLAAFENDFLVRDPDVSIGGTKLVRISVKNANVAIAESFKVTGSLDVVSPDQEQVVSGTPSFVWKDDSGEDHYQIRVFDAYGTKVWEDLAVPGVSGNKNVTVSYGGPALQAGLLYQFRAISIKQGGSAISATEDLRGVFLYR
jgi:hypothetical protein